VGGKESVEACIAEASGCDNVFSWSYPGRVTKPNYWDCGRLFVDKRGEKCKEPVVLTDTREVRNIKMPSFYHLLCRQLDLR
jgi:hypothetical protein